MLSIQEVKQDKNTRGRRLHLVYCVQTFHPNIVNIKTEQTFQSSINFEIWETSEWPSELNIVFRVCPLAMEDKGLMLAVWSMLLTKVTLLLFEFNISVLFSAPLSEEFKMCWMFLSVRFYVGGSIWWPTGSKVLLKEKSSLHINQLGHKITINVFFKI